MNPPFSGARGQQFPRRVRLRGRRTIISLCGSPYRRTGRFVEVLFQPRLPVGFIINASKQCGSAVKRNRAKRIVREFLRSHKEIWPPNHQVMIRLRQLPNDESVLLNELEQLLAEIK